MGLRMDRGIRNSDIQVRGLRENKGGEAEEAVDNYGCNGIECLNKLLTT